MKFGFPMADGICCFPKPTGVISKKTKQVDPFETLIVCSFFSDHTNNDTHKWNLTSTLTVSVVGSFL